jgi:glycosyltransferase involved in cell wall biosynthesis
VRVCVGVHVHERPDDLRATLAALAAGSSAHELLLLPDGADAETALRAAEAGAHVSATSDARGAPACFNRLAEESDADVLVLLESGTLVGRGWLDRLCAALREPHVGVAGPSTNAAWNEQCAFPRARLDELAELAAEAARRFGDRVQELAPLYSLGDFCYAVRRDAVDAVGRADEGYGLGPCWEMDYNVRAARAGFRGVWVCGAYVHRLPFTPRRARAERELLEPSLRRYQDSFCGLRLRGVADGYRAGCLGDACEHFAPPELIAIAPTTPRRPPARRSRPLVSCVMPTGNRRELALRAVEYFERQDYPNRELVVVDHGDDGLREALRGEPIAYVRAAAGETIGAKRNRACETARGDVLVQWDDDDWYGADRLSTQVNPILRGGADITGLRCDALLDLPRWEFWGCSDELHARLYVGDVHGGTLAFRRSVWESGAYPSRSLAEDAWLLWSAQRRGARLERLSGAGRFVYVRHGGNAWQFEPGRHVDPAGWRRIDEPPLPPDDRAFLRSLVAPPPPLVTCVMPTRDRRAFVPRAIACFLAQIYSPRELLILDDGADAIGDLVPPDPRIRYVRLTEPLVLGAKRNQACELARGELIAHWDDDDWHAPSRLAYQVAELERTGTGVCGPRRVLHLDPAARRAWLYAYPQARRCWVAGNALLYRRSFWRQNPFPAVGAGEDTRFVWSAGPANVHVHDEHRLIVAVVHSGNTSPKRTDDSLWTEIAVAEVAAVLGADAPAYLG